MGKTENHHGAGGGGNLLADAFAKHIPKDQLFFFATIEKNGSLSILTSIQSIDARVELLNKILAQYQEEKAGGDET